MNDLIEKLKDKNYVRPFGLMSEKEQEVYRKAGKKNCLVYDHVGWISSSITGSWITCTTYAIKSDYQSEPEYVDLEIKVDTKYPGYEWLGVLDEDCPFPLPHIFNHLHYLPSLPNFKCFWCGEKDYLDYVDIERVATLLMDKENKVYARFRK